MTDDELVTALRKALDTWDGRGDPLVAQVAAVKAYAADAIRGAICETFDSDHDNALVGAWLDEYADRYAPGPWS